MKNDAREPRYMDENSAFRELLMAVLEEKLSGKSSIIHTYIRLK